MSKIGRLKLAYMFVSSRRLARHILHDERESDNLLQISENILRKPMNTALMMGSNPQVLGIANLFLLNNKDYYQKAVFGAEQGTMLFIIRSYESFEHMARELSKEIAEHLEEHNIDQEAKEELTKTIQSVSKEEDSIHDILSRAVQSLRHEKRDRERLNDRMAFTFRKEHTMVHSLKEMRRDYKKERHLNKADESIIKQIEKLMEHPEANGKKLEELAGKLEKKVLADVDILNEVVEDALFVIKYAVTKFFACEHVEEEAKKYFEAARDKKYITKETYAKIEEAFNQHEAWKHDQARTTFRIIKKYRRKTGGGEID